MAHALLEEPVAFDPLALVRAAELRADLW